MAQRRRSKRPAGPAGRVTTGAWPWRMLRSNRMHLGLASWYIARLVTGDPAGSERRSSLPAIRGPKQICPLGKPARAEPPGNAPPRVPLTRQPSWCEATRCGLGPQQHHALLRPGHIFRGITRRFLMRPQQLLRNQALLRQAATGDKRKLFRHGNPVGQVFVLLGCSH